MGRSLKLKLRANARILILKGGSRRGQKGRVLPQLDSQVLGAGVGRDTQFKSKQVAGRVMYEGISERNPESGTT